MSFVDGPPEYAIRIQHWDQLKSAKLDVRDEWIKSLCVEGNPQNLPTDKNEAKRVLQKVRKKLETLTGHRLTWSYDIHPDGQLDMVALVKGGSNTGTGFTHGWEAASRTASHLSDLFHKDVHDVTADSEVFNLEKVRPEQGDDNCIGRVRVRFSNFQTAAERLDKVIADVRQKHNNVGVHCDTALHDKGVYRFEIPARGVAS